MSRSFSVGAASEPPSPATKMPAVSGTAVASTRKSRCLAADVKAWATEGGLVASMPRTIARRLQVTGWHFVSKVTEPGDFTYSSRLALAMRVSTMRFLRGIGISSW